MKYHILLVLCILIPFLGHSQNDYRNWRKGPLTWNDFKTVPHSIAGEHSYLEFYLNIGETHETHDGVDIWTTNAEAYMDRRKSWVDTHYRNPYELYYNQTIFDLVELYRRQMQIELDTGGTPNIDYYMRRLIAEVDSLSVSTMAGADSQAVQMWNLYIHEQLDSTTPAMVNAHTMHMQAPRFLTTHRLTFAMGGAMQFTAGSLHQYFRNGGGMDMDCEIGSWRNIFKFGMYIGGSRCLKNAWQKDERDADQDLYSGDRLTALDLNFDYGLAAIDNYRFRLMPFVGLGMTGYYYTPSQVDATSVGPTAFNWRFGIDARYHIHSTLMRYRQHVELSQFSVYAKLYVAPTRFRQVIDEPHGPAINLAIGIAFQERGGSVKK